jgi:hypothetical protein
MKVLRINKMVGIDVPLVPNFIRVDGQMISIKDFSERALKIVAREWTKQLIEKSKLPITPKSNQ